MLLGFVPVHFELELVFRMCAVWCAALLGGVFVFADFVGVFDAIRAVWWLRAVLRFVLWADLSCLCFVEFD